MMGKLVLKPQGRKLDGKSVKATINLLGVSGKVDIKISGDQLKELEHGQHHLHCNKSPAVRQIKFSNQGEVTGFVKLVTVEANVGITPDKFLLDPGQEKEVKVSVYKENLSFSVFTGSELVRQVMKRCFLMPGANKLFNNSALDNVDFTCQFPGEGDIDETVLTSLTVMDVVHFYKKTVKNVIIVSDNNCDWSSKFRGLTVEETLSETRIDQSIALPMVTRHQATGQLVLLPSHIQLDINCETIVRLQNRQSHLVHWDLTWPTDMIDCTPKEGSLAPGGQSVICVQAIGSPGHQSWRGQVMVYSDNGVDKLEVTINPSPVIPPLLVTNRCVDLGTAVVGSTTNGMATVTNTSHCLVQWSGLVEPSFFSLSQPGGILNPGQSVNLGVQFKPPVPGNHSTTVSLRCVQVKGGQEGGPVSGPVKVTVTGKAVSLKEAALSLPSVVTSTAVVSKKGGGSLSLETDFILFPDTAVGDVSVAKVKLKNRSGSDQEVEIVGQGGGHFKTVHSVATVKSQCFCTVPVQFRPIVRGTHSEQISFRWGGENIITATLRGKAI